MTTNEKPAKRKQLWTIQSQRIMLASIIVGVLICVAVFTVMGIVMTKQSNGTIDDIGEMYTKNMGNQIAEKFQSVMNQRFTMVKALVEEYNDSADVGKELAASASAREFKFLAFYSVENMNDLESGSSVDMLLGKI